MTGKWIFIALLIAVAMFGLSGLSRHKWKIRLALIGMAMGLSPPHADSINAIATSAIFSVIFLLIGSVIDFIATKVFNKEKKKEIGERPAIQAADEGDLETLKEFDLEKVKRIAKAKSKKPAE